MQILDWLYLWVLNLRVCDISPCSDTWVCFKASPQHNIIIQAPWEKRKRLASSFGHKHQHQQSLCQKELLPLTWIQLSFQNDWHKPLCRACNVPSKVISFLTKPLQSHTEKKLYTSQAALVTKLVLNFFPSPEDVHNCRLHFTADKWTTGLTRALPTPQ